jgi:signal transduction histidine kinase
MPYRLWKGMRTLSFRLAAWNAFVVLLTTIAILAMVRQGVRYRLVYEMDEILQEDIREIQLTLHQPQADFAVIKKGLQRKAEGHSRHGWFVELHDAATHDSWSTLQGEQSPPEADHIALDEPTNVGNYRVVRTELANFPQFTDIRVGARLDFQKDAMNQIDRLVMIAFGAAVILAPAVGYSLARRAARTMGDMIETAGRLRPDHLLERLPVQGTGDELDHLAITVNNLLDRIAAYVQKRRDFLANAAHELRTPLAAVRSSVEVALNREPSAEEFQELMADVIEQCTALEILVNQLLLLSEAENTDLVEQAQVCRLDQIVRRSAEMFEGVADAGQVTLQLKEVDEVEVQGDRQHWRQVVNNLVDNAIKYTKPGGKVVVSLRHDRGAHQAIFSVVDTGIGIPSEDLPKVYDRFYRADRARRHHPTLGGSGLGLCICKAIVEAYHGTIQCKSVLNQGTTFTVVVRCSCCGDAYGVKADIEAAAGAGNS